MQLLNFKKDYYLNEKVGLRISDEPWRGMKQIDPLPESLRKWLADWQVVFNEDFPDRGIRKAVPAIFINPSYKPPVDSGTVPKRPQAYAVFGLFGVPLSIAPVTNRTPKPVDITNAPIKGLNRETIKRFEAVDIPFIDGIASLWTDLVDNLLDQEPEDSRFLISDARKSVEELNGDLTYYDGVNREVSEKLKADKYDTDVKLANADPAALADTVGDLGLAKRVIQQARKVVSEDAWKLSHVGLTDSQVETLRAAGITSNGQLVDAANKSDEASRTVLVKLLGIEGLNPESWSTIIENVRATAINKMTLTSASLVANTSLYAVAGVSPENTGRLGNAGIVTAEDLAGADGDKIAEATGVTKEEANVLIDNAKEISVHSMDVSKLAFGDAATANSLKGADINTIGALIAASPEKVADALNVRREVAVGIQNAVREGLMQR
jgi:hypothetical protein